METLMLIDDDPGIRRMLGLLIREHSLGRVVCELESGEHAVEELLFYRPRCGADRPAASGSRWGAHCFAGARTRIFGEIHHDFTGDRPGADFLFPMRAESNFLQ